MFKLNALALAAACVPIFAFLANLNVAMTAASVQAIAEAQAPLPAFYEARTATVADLGRIEVIGKRASLADEVAVASSR